MGSAVVHDVRAQELRPKLIAGRFFPNGTSNDPLAFEGKGVASVVRAGSAGVFTVTLKESYAKLVSAVPGVQHPTAADLVAQFGAFVNVGGASPITFTIRTLAGATPTDITGNADASVSFQLLFEDTV